MGPFVCTETVLVNLDVHIEMRFVFTRWARLFPPPEPDGSIWMSTSSNTGDMWEIQRILIRYKAADGLDRTGTQIGGLMSPDLVSFPNPKVVLPEGKWGMETCSITRR